MPPVPQSPHGEVKLHEGSGYTWALDHIQSLGFSGSYTISACGYKTFLSQDLTTSTYNKHMQGADQRDAYVPYIHLFSFDFFVEILKNQITTLLRKLFHKKRACTLKIHAFSLVCQTQPDRSSSLD